MELIVNKLPSPTWSWLRMNQSKLEASVEGEAKLEFEIPKGISYDVLKKDVDGAFSSGVGEEFVKLVEDAGINTHKFFLAPATEVEEALRINLKLEKNENLAGIIELEISEGSSMTLIMDYSAAELACGFAAMQTRIKLGKNSKLRLVQVQRFEGNSKFVNDISSIGAENSYFKLIKLILSGKDTYDGMAVDLIGKNSEFDTEIAYVVEDDNRLDMNYIIKHEGVKTKSCIDVKGVLRDKASKTFRGTIDIKKGAVNASGRENEEVLLIDDDVINKSIPVILCAEEDVEGAHGATIGRLDEEILFYMKSRGIPEEEIYEIMANARIEELCQKIEDEPTIKLVHDFIGGRENA